MDTQSLKLRLYMPLYAKIELTILRIRQWIERWGVDNVHLNYSGGKDSEVLRHLINVTVKKYFNDVNVVKVFCNTRNENPHNVRHVLSVRDTDSVVIVYPKLTPKEVIEKYGYPISTKNVAGAIYRFKLNPEKNMWRLHKKRAKGYIPLKWRFLLQPNAPRVSDYCCDKLKKSALKSWAKKHKSHPFIGCRVAESSARKSRYVSVGCNAYNMKEPQSWPIAFWNDTDIDTYIKNNNIQVSKAYLTERRTGCMICGFGIDYDKDRFIRMQEDHPRWFAEAKRLGYVDVLRACEQGLKLPCGRLTGGTV